MDKENLVKQLINIAKQNDVEIAADVLGVIVNEAVFRVVPKGSILQNVGEKQKQQLWYLMSFVDFTMWTEMVTI